MMETPGQDPAKQGGQQASQPAAPPAQPDLTQILGPILQAQQQAILAEVGKMISPLLPKPADQPTKETVDTLSQALKSLQSQLEEKEIESELRQGLSGIPWFDSEDAFHRLRPEARRDAQTKKLVFDGSEMVGTVKVPKVLTPAERAQLLAKERPYLVRAAQTPGTLGLLGGQPGGGAQGGGTAMDWGSLSFKEALDRARLDKAGLASYIRDHPAEWAAKRAAGLVPKA